MVRRCSVVSRVVVLSAAVNLPLPAMARLPDPLTLEYALSLADAPHPSLNLVTTRLDAARAE